MKIFTLHSIGPGILLGALMALATSLSAQTAAESADETMTKDTTVETSPSAQHRMGGMMTDHHDEAANDAADEIGLATECQAMAAKKQAMVETRQDMDAKLDALVVTMNAAGNSKSREAMKPMAAVITELVAQRKAGHAMMMEMEPEMMRHMMRHNAPKGVHPASHHSAYVPNDPAQWTAKKDAMDCPMMKTPAASGAQGGEMTP